tara:strand:+ start:1314 stop:2312 length:999 start_codon:yes stop_codon:yes gene_type:complete
MAKSEVYKNLPGFEVPVGEALNVLSSMWDAPASSDERAPSEFRASRMNLILHLGFDCSHEDANAVFQTALDFSRRYPCRIVFLCAQPDSWDAESGMVCKIYSQCDIGLSGTDMSCCEVLALGYTLGDRQYLENQVSLFLETDLPTYYWPVLFDSAELLSYYKFFFKQANRIVFDTARERFAIEDVLIDQPEKIHDIAHSRFLSVRQSIGQFMSSFPVADIIDGLESASISGSPCFKAEGHALIGWIREILDTCYGEDSRTMVSITEDFEESDCAALVLAFSYSNENGIECVMNFDAGQAIIEATLAGENHSATSGVKLLEPAEALAEALFFS